MSAEYAFGRRRAQRDLARGEANAMSTGAAAGWRSCLSGRPAHIGVIGNLASLVLTTMPSVPHRYGKPYTLPSKVCSGARCPAAPVETARALSSTDRWLIDANSRCAEVMRSCEAGEIESGAPVARSLEIISSLFDRVTSTSIPVSC